MYLVKISFINKIFTTKAIEFTGTVEFIAYKFMQITKSLSTTIF